ncbi:hypothetical protein D3C81_2066530 [compost metagenome]
MLDALKSAREAAGLVQGERQAFAIDPLESAIGSTAQMIADERDRLSNVGLPHGCLIDMLGAHLERLLRLQLESLAREAKIDLGGEKITAILSDIYGIRRTGQ